MTLFIQYYNTFPFVHFHLINFTVSLFFLSGYKYCQKMVRIIFQLSNLKSIRENIERDINEVNYSK